MNHEHTATKTVLTTLQDAWHTLSRRLEHLLYDDSPADGQLEHLELVESLLHSLPLASGEFGQAQNRIRNARWYYQASEVGAARYELRLLACSLRHLFADELPVEPRRRLRRPAVGTDYS